MADDPQERRRGPEGWDPNATAEGVEALDAAGYEPDATYDPDAQPNRGDEGSRETAAASYVQMALEEDDLTLKMGAVEDHMRDFITKAAASQGYRVVFTEKGFTLEELNDQK